MPRAGRSASCTTKHVGEEPADLEEAVAESLEWIMVRMDLLVFCKYLFLYYCDAMSCDAMSCDANIYFCAIMLR